MTDDNVIPLRELPDETPPTIEDLLASDILLWDVGDSMRIRCRTGVSKTDAAAWLRHVADHLDPADDLDAALARVHAQFPDWPGDDV